MSPFPGDSARLGIAQAVGEGGQMPRGGDSKPCERPELFQGIKSGRGSAVHARSREVQIGR